MQLMESLQGQGMLCVNGCEPSPAQYSLSYWRETSGGDLVGVGHISSVITAMQMAGRGAPTMLQLADGRSVDVMVRHRGAGTAWGYVEVSSPHRPNSETARVYCMDIERARANVVLCTGMGEEAESPEERAIWLNLSEAWAQLLPRSDSETA